MQKPEVVLDILNKRSLNKLEIRDIYRCLLNKEWYLIAYNKLAKNKGVLTSSETGETIDGMCLKRIDNIIEELMHEKYSWHKSRVIEISKKSGGFRKLSVAEWRDKLLQEVLRMILSAIYEPRFSEASHGFRSGRGCHTALTRIKQKSRGCEWFIEGDITKCFDTINHEILLDILKKTIKDGRFIELIRKMLKAGKFSKDFVYGKTYSGTPQGGVLSPLLANIYLNELDQYIETVLYQKYNKEEKRPLNKIYVRISGQIQRSWKKYKETKDPDILENIHKLEKIRRKMPTKEDINNCEFRRLSYTRYADDWIISFTGTKEEAIAIRDEIKHFLYNNLKLELNNDKTKITNSKKDYARFLGYNIGIQISNNTIIKGKRYVNGEIGFFIPDDVINEKIRKYTKNGKACHLSERINETEFDIITLYQAELRGIAQYYKFARNQHKLNTLKFYMETSLLRTLAAKHKTHISVIRKLYGGTKEVDGYNYKVIKKTIIDKNNKAHTAYFGAIPFKRVVAVDNVRIEDIISQMITIKNRSSLSSRLENNVCELCGSTDNVQMHHIHKLKNIKNSKAEWAKKMIAMNRKTIALCQKCHNMIHAGKYNGRKLR